MSWKKTFMESADFRIISAWFCRTFRVTNHPDMKTVCGTNLDDAEEMVLKAKDES